MAYPSPYCLASTRDVTKAGIAVLGRGRIGPTVLSRSDLLTLWYMLYLAKLPPALTDLARTACGVLFLYETAYLGSDVRNPKQKACPVSTASLDKKR